MNEAKKACPHGVKDLNLSKGQGGWQTRTEALGPAAGLLPTGQLLGAPKFPTWSWWTVQEAEPMWKWDQLKQLAIMSCQGLREAETQHLEKTSSCERLTVSHLCPPTCTGWSLSFFWKWGVCRRNWRSCSHIGVGGP